MGLITFRSVKDGIFSNNSGINLAVVGNDECAILILRPDEDIVGWVNLPEKLKVKIFNSSAQYPIGSLWDYGVTERNPYEVFEKSLGLSMGVVVSRTIKINEGVTLEAVLGNLHRINLRTDLSLRDRFLVRQYLADAVASKKVLEMDIPANAMDKVIEPDGKEFLIFNGITSLWTKNKFLLEAILNEKVNVTVNNLSGLSGLGISLAKQLESAGVRVTEVKTDPNRDISGSGCIYSSWGDYPNTERFLQDQVKCQHRSGDVLEEEQIEVWLK